MENSNNVIVNGITLAEHRELGRAMAVVVETLRRMSNGTDGRTRPPEFFGELAQRFDFILMELAEAFRDACGKAMCDSVTRDQYPYPRFSIDGDMLIPAAEEGGEPTVVVLPGLWV